MSSQQVAEVEDLMTSVERIVEFIKLVPEDVSKHKEGENRKRFNYSICLKKTKRVTIV